MTADVALWLAIVVGLVTFAAGVVWSSHGQPREPREVCPVCRDKCGGAS